MKKSLVFTCLSLFIIFTSVKSGFAESTQIDSLLNYLYEEQKFMGTVAISHDGKVVYANSFGYTDLAKKQKLNNDSKLRIGSITKTITSAMVFGLIEEGKLSLATPLAEFFPQFPNSKDITISHLLNHRSGLYNFTNSEDYLGYHTKPKSRNEMIDILLRYDPVFLPGESADYSNTNYVLLGFIIEDLTGNSFAEEVQRRICRPLGLTNTYFGKKIDPAANEALPYIYSNGNWNLEAETDMSVPHGAGAIVSTSTELLKFKEALFAGKLISKASLDQMISLSDGYGMGIFRFPFNEKFAYGHTGGIDGFQSMLSYFPKEKVTVAVLGNGVNYNFNEIMIGILSLYFEGAYQFPSFAPAIQLPDKLLAKYTGVFASNDLPLEITIGRSEHGLTAQATGQPAFSLDAVSETEFKFDMAGVVLLFTDHPEKNEFILRQAGMEFVFRRKEK